ncbi:hypothetical protein D3C72_2405440 [compost metagenome]
MSRVAEIPFIAMQVGPFHPQPAGDIATQPGGKNLRQQQPDDRRDAQHFGAGAFVRPG